MLYWIFALFSLESVQGTLDEATIVIQNKQVFELEWGVFQDTLPIHLCLLFEHHTPSCVLSGVFSEVSLIRQDFSAMLKVAGVLLISCS